MPVRELLTVDEAAKTLGCSTDGVRKMIQRGHLRAVKAGPRCWLIDQREVEARMEAAPVGRRRQGYRPESRRG